MIVTQGLGCSKCQGMGDDSSGLDFSSIQTWLMIGLAALIVVPHFAKPKRS